jgi:hypothetical protein
MTNMPAVPLLVFSASCFYALLSLTTSVPNSPKSLIFLSHQPLPRFHLADSHSALILSTAHPLARPPLLYHITIAIAINIANTPNININNITTTPSPLTMLTATPTTLPLPRRH